MVQFPDFGTVSEWRYGGGDKQGPIIGRLRYFCKAIPLANIEGPKNPNII